MIKSGGNLRKYGTISRKSWREDPNMGARYMYPLKIPCNYLFFILDFLHVLKIPIEQSWLHVDLRIRCDEPLDTLAISGLVDGLPLENAGSKSKINVKAGN